MREPNVQAPDYRRLLERVEELEAAMQRLHERDAIVECLHRYTRGLDRHDSEVLASVFHDDAVLRYGPDVFTTGQTDFVPWANRFHEASWTSHVHMIDVNAVEIDGDVAHTVTYVWFSLRRKDGRTIDVGAGRYVDRLERRDGEWKIAVREMLLEWSGTLAAAPPVPDHASGTWDRSDPSYRRPLELDLGR